MSSALVDESAVSLHEKFCAGELQAQEIVEAHLARLEAVDPQVRAFLHVDAESARRTARIQDGWTPAQRRQRPLAGVPVAIKDNIVTGDMPTTAGSKILSNFRAPYEATVMRLLKEAGAIVIGKTNLDEFAMGSSTEHSAFFPTKNPWDLTRVPGGSSGGSAAAVAARLVPVALGSDTGGSIRQPAAYTGIVGLKPTYGAVSRYGLIAFASSLDQIGPLTRSVADARYVFDVIHRHDPQDATSVAAYTPVTRDASKPLTIGVPEEYFSEGLDPRVADRVRNALAVLEEHGARLVTISLPHSPYAISAYYLIAPAEASSNLARYDGVRYGYRAEAKDLVSLYETTRDEGFGPEVKRRILLGTHALSTGYYDAYYLKAQKVRTLIRDDFQKAFQAVDVIVTPTTPDLPFKLGERQADPLAMYLGDIYTVPANLAGIPGLSLPAGQVDGLPVGLQLLAPWFGEAVLFEAAGWVESLMPRATWPEIETGGASHA